MAYMLIFLLKNVSSFCKATHIFSPKIADIFAEKMWVAFAFAKATHIFLNKNTCELDIVLTRTVNILTTNELVKLAMLWTTVPWSKNTRKLQTEPRWAWPQTFM